MIEQIALFWGVDKGTVLVPFSILLSSLIGACIAIWAVLNNWKIAERNHQMNRLLTKQKNSMDFVNDYIQATDILQATKEVSALTKHTASEKQKWAIDPTDKEAQKNTHHIRTVLNHYEAMAICIHRNIYDEEIIKETVYSTVITIWGICSPYIEEKNRSKGTTTFYQDLRILVARWEKEPLKKK